MIQVGDFELLLIRHGVAQEWAPGGDAERPLSPNGKAQLRQAALGLARLGLTIDAAMSSPFVRARETAEIYLAELGPDAPIEHWAGLTPAAPAQATVEELLALGKQVSGARVAVFGHNPNISSVISWLVAGHGHTFFNVAPGDVIHLQIPTSMPFVRAAQTPRAVVLGFYPRESLEKIGASS